MPRFAANLSMMFTEWPFLDRFAAAAGAGFDAVEFQFPYDHAPEEIAARLERNGLGLVNFNLPPGKWLQGERGYAAVQGRQADFRISVDIALAYARATGVKRMHALSGNAPADDPGARATYRDSLRYAAERLGEWNIDLLIEPLNPRDAPGYFLNDFNRAAEVIADVGLPNLKLLYDIYHRQILHGDVTGGLRALYPVVGHIQIASAPSRQEPDTEELSFAHLCAEIDRLGYPGHVGCEYRPRSGTLEGLGWFTARMPPAKAA